MYPVDRHPSRQDSPDLGTPSGGAADVGRHRLHCPWSHKLLTPQGFDLDHLIPLAAHSINDLWSLVPRDPVHNQHVNRARLLGPARLHPALQALEQTYHL